MDRRNVLKSAAMLAAAGLLPSAGFSEKGILSAMAPDAHDAFPLAEARKLAADPLRPQFHLLPRHNWMNDPNGPIYWKGMYHMFFQYNPTAAVWGDMHWNHAVSLDKVHWRHLPIALAPTPGGPDAAGCFSGTAVDDNGVVTVIYTGVVDTTEAQETIPASNPPMRESQCLATSTDPELKIWRKEPRAVIAAPPAGMAIAGFRDPAPWRSGDWWYMAIGSGMPGVGGEILLYRSRNLRAWEYLHKLVEGQGSGRRTSNPVDDGDMWECPDFFALDDQHVLLHSTEGHVHWQSGALDESAMKFHPERAGLVDQGNFYASKTQIDQHGHRILWGWINEQRPVSEYSAAGWAGMMSLPRVLSLLSNGQLHMEFDPTLHKLRRDGQSLAIVTSTTADQLQALKIRQATGEFAAVLGRGDQPFELSMLGHLPGGELPAPVFKLAYDPKKPESLILDGSPVPLAGEATEPLEVHAYVDGSVIELILHGQIAYTKRFYYEGDTAPNLWLKMDGDIAALQSLQVWQIRPISTDRLTS